MTPTRTISTLPEDIVRSILSYCIPPIVPDDIIISRSAMGQERMNTACRIFVVCKQWRRIGTPLLYRHLRITMQSTLWEILDTLNEHPGLGSAVHTLVLGEGMGRDFRRLVGQTPNIDTLHITCLSIRTWSASTGLLHAIPQMRIKTLYFDAYIGGRTIPNKVVGILEKAVREAMLSHWSQTLTSVTITHSPRGKFNEDMLDTLRQLPCLERITFISEELASPPSQFWFFHISKFMALVDAPRLSTIRCLGITYREIILAKLEQLGAPQRFIDMFVFVWVSCDYSDESDWPAYRKYVKENGLVFADPDPVELRGIPRRVALPGLP